MIDNHHRGMSAEAELRLFAEERLRSGAAKTSPSPADDDTLRLYHELQVHQVELELQNAELRQSRDDVESALEKYTDLFDFAPVGYFTLDCNTLITSVNLAGAGLIGGVRTKLIGQRFGLLVVSSDRPTFTEFLAKVLACKIKETCEVELLNKKKQSVIVQIEATASASGHEFRLALFNITGRKQLETEIQDAREYAENIVETVREPLVVLDACLKILTANLSFYETFKVTPEETIGNYIYDLGNRQWDIPKLRVLFEEILHYQSVFNGYEVEHDFIEIGRKIILLNARQIFRKNIGTHIILLAMEDITERKLLSEELQKAHDKLGHILDERTKELSSANVQQQETSASNRRLEEVSQIKSDFLANMSHELRTPLNSVIGFSEMLQDQMFGPINAKQQEYITNILTSGKHLLSLINDILDLSKVESGKMELELSAFSLRETIEASLMMLMEKAHKGGIELHMELGEEVDERIVADQRKLKQILFNLVSNAVKFTPPGGSVNVSAIKKGEFIEVTVTDNGMGIKKDDIPKLFRAFTQLESVFTKEYEGTGLGLALTSQLVQLHGGTIKAESEFGSGSRFSFTIPLRNTTGIT
jgi:two-component system CheB/CheR fusion protein